MQSCTVNLNKLQRFERTFVGFGDDFFSWGGLAVQASDYRVPVQHLPSTKG